MDCAENLAGFEKRYQTARHELNEFASGRFKEILFQNCHSK